LKNFNSWNEAVEVAGLEATYVTPIEEEKLFEELRRVCIKLGRVPTKMAIQRESKFSAGTYNRRFGSWQNALLAFKNWLETNKIDFPYLNQLPDIKRKIQKVKEVTNERAIKFQPEWQGTKSSRYGPILNFRGLQHAPMNEQGVVYLFGVVSFKLGFIIEAIGTEYPDCEGKRLVDKKKGIWERVTIEFEYKSSNFKDQGHDPRKCDLIVCWKHDWPDCPIEVLELKSKIKEIEE